MQSVQNYNFFTMCFPFEYHDEDPKDLFSLRLTAARTTVTSSTLPPATLPNPLARAFFANGDKKFSSCDNLRAINAMEFAQAWILAASGAEDPDCNDRISSCNTESGMLSKTPSVAKRITSPSSTLNSYLSADSGASLSTSVANSEGGKDS